MNTWHIVHVTGIIQAVYGGALKEFAEVKAKQMEESSGFIAGVTTITGPRPKVGAEFRPPSTQEP